ncbi:cytochrome P450 [Panaeolus papilionaceus]|nr:cytochrome P450 [Panaeolus papilionaceus]
MPPGPKRLLTILPSLVGPPVLTGALLVFLKNHNYLHQLSLWAIPAICLAVHPVLFYVNCYARRFFDWRAASRLGAVLPPLVTDTGMTVISRAKASFINGYPGEALYNYMKDHGQNFVGFHFFGNKTLFTVEPHHIKAVLATQFETFEKGPTTFQQFGSLLGVGIFNSDGEMFHRVMTRPFFTKERISDFEIYARTSDRSLDEAQMRLAEGYSIDFQDLVGRFTLDSATAFLTGKSVDSLEAGLPYPPHSSHKNTSLFYNHPSTPFLHAFNEGLSLTGLRLGAGDEWPLFEFWKDKVGEHRNQIDTFVEPIVQEALRNRENRIKHGAGDVEKKDGETTLLAHLVNHTQDSKILTDELLNLLVAGRDTTMSLLSFALYMLIENPHIERKLRQEIFEKVGAHNTPTYENMREMRYTRAFLNEVLRLYPSVPIDARTNTQAAVLESAKGSNEPPIYIPAGTAVAYSVLYMHRRKDLWGPDALVFDPDRFLDERLHKYLTPNPFIFCPFNAGPRICLGQQFAYHEATFYLVRLLQRFTHFKLDEDHGVNVRPPAEWKQYEGPRGRDKIMPHLSLTMAIRGGLWITMEELKLHDPEA